MANDTIDLVLDNMLKEASQGSDFIICLKQLIEMKSTS